MKLLKDINAWAESHIWTFALIVAAVFSPLIIWGAWDTISAAPSTALGILLSLGTVLVAYIGLGLLLMWNRWTQRKNREKGNN